MGNSLAELGKRGQRIKTEAPFISWPWATFLKYIQKAKRTGELKTKEKAETLARYLLNLWNGINITQEGYPREGPA